MRSFSTQRAWNNLIKPKIIHLRKFIPRNTPAIAHKMFCIYIEPLIKFMEKLNHLIGKIRPIAWKKMLRLPSSLPISYAAQALNAIKRLPGKKRHIRIKCIVKILKLHQSDTFHPYHYNDIKTPLQNVINKLDDSDLIKVLYATSVNINSLRDGKFAFYRPERKEKKRNRDLRRILKTKNRKLTKAQHAILDIIENELNQLVWHLPL